LTAANGLEERFYFVIARGRRFDGGLRAKRNRAACIVGAADAERFARFVASGARYGKACRQVQLFCSRFRSAGRSRNRRDGFEELAAVGGEYLAFDAARLVPVAFLVVIGDMSDDGCVAVANSPVSR
jgi:hypothetical protein